MGTNASKDNGRAGSPRNNDNEFEQVERDPTRSARSSSPDVGMNDLSKSTVLVDNPGSAAASRRIIKATPPTPTNETTAASSGAGAGGGPAPADIASSEETSNNGNMGIPSDDEILQDSLDQSRSKRMQKLQAKQKSNRQHVLDERRKGNYNKGITPKKPAPQANPFSRFLSAFSVESEFPQHKRKDFQDEEHDLLPAKKVRKDEGPDDSKKPTSLKEYLDFYVLDPILHPTSNPWKTAAVTAAAGLVIIAIRSTRKH